MGLADLHIHTISVNHRMKSMSLKTGVRAYGVGPQESVDNEKGMVKKPFLYCFSP